jgi:UDP-GlcNAc:undecaprenyl-phosphate GlcNAc-1-phosphate transferase
MILDSSSWVFLASMLVCVVLIYLLRGLCSRYGLVDRPGGRKTHLQATPLAGGLAMFVATANILLWVDSLNEHCMVLLAASALLVMLGTFDDIHGLAARLRLLIQAVVSLIVIYGAGGTVLHSGNIFGFDLVLGVMAIPFSVIAFVGGINAINMIDGADGMAGKMGFITMTGVIIMLISSGGRDLLPLAFAVMGALAGFLLFNARILVRRAWVFMGDAGSMWLGLILGWFMAQITKGDVAAHPPIVLWIFGLPLIDTLAVMIRRMSRKKSPFSADRSHIHHVLEHAGLSVRKTVLILSVAQAVLVAIGVVFYLAHVSAAMVFWCFVLMFAAYYFALRYGWKDYWLTQSSQ